jgi:predicted deoxyguanosinetriphosphate triphosphohydrolase
MTDPAGYDRPRPTDWACERSAGRLKPEPPDGVRNDFQRDRDRIIHAKAFRRLMHKTQVFISPDGDHYRTRLTHTLEMMQVARTIARSLDLNEDLTEAIALGHDLGHTPFGHTGEQAHSQALAAHGQPCDHRRAGRALAHPAVAIADVVRLRADPIAHGTAQAATLER